MGESLSASFREVLDACGDVRSALRGTLETERNPEKKLPTVNKKFCCEQFLVLWLFVERKSDTI